MFQMPEWVNKDNANKLGRGVAYTVGGLAFEGICSFAGVAMGLYMPSCIQYCVPDGPPFLAQSQNSTVCPNGGDPSYKAGCNKEMEVGGIVGAGVGLLVMAGFFGGRKLINCLRSGNGVDMTTSAINNNDTLVTATEETGLLRRRLG